MKNIRFTEMFKSSFYALKLLWGVSPKRVVHMALVNLIGYFTWAFYSAFFVRYLVTAIQSGAPFGRIILYIAVVVAVTALLQLYVAYVNNVVIPIDDVKVYKDIYGKLYKKAENLELSRFEDSAFYNQYTMALDDTCTRVTSVAGNIFNIVAAALAGIVGYVTMYNIDKMLLLFVLAPLLGNFLFGTLASKVGFKIYRESTPYNRRTDYVNRVMYLADYAKEIRLSNIFRVLRRMYDDATEQKIKVVTKHKLGVMIFEFFRFYFTYIIIFEGLLLYGGYCALVTKTISLADITVLTSVMSFAAFVLIGIADNLKQASSNGTYIYRRRSCCIHRESLPGSAGI